MRKVGVVLVALVGIAALAMMLLPPPAPPPPPARPRIIVPIPVQPVRPCPPWRPRCPQESLTSAPLPSLIGAAVGGRVCPDGTPLAADYPASRHLENSRGRDGLGLCVYTSAAMAMDWQGIRDGRQLRDWMTKRPGGGTPTKFTQDMEAFWREKGLSCPAYIQYQGRDIGPIIKAVSSGRLVCGTYYRSPTGRYGGARISHMVNYPLADGTHFAVLDNNHIGERSYEHMGREEFERCVKDELGMVWAIIFTDPPPPPAPHNAEKGGV